MQTKLFLIFNHDLTVPQRETAAASLGVHRFMKLPPALQRLWSEIPPDLDSVSTYLYPVTCWLAEQAKTGDYALIQGDFGATFFMVNRAFEQALIPVYSTTARDAAEKHNGDGSVETTHRVQHVTFRKYERQ